MRVRLFKTVAIMLLLSMILALLPLSLLNISYSADSFAPPSVTAVAGGGGAAGVPSSGGTGIWNRSMQGFRITVLDHSGDPAFTFMGKDSLDILFSTNGLSGMDYFDGGDKLSGTRMNNFTKYATNINNISAKVITLQSIYDQLKSGALDTTLPEDGNKSVAIERVKPSNVSYYLTQEGSSWVKWGTEVKKDFFGAGNKMDVNALLYTLLNLQTKKSDGTYLWLWQPKAGAYYNNNNSITESELAEFKAGNINPVSLMSSRRIAVTVEPIIWNKLRVSAGTYSYGVYGSQTTIGGIMMWLENGGYYRPVRGAGLGGYDTAIFGRVGRKAMVAANYGIAYHSYTEKPSGKRVLNYDWYLLPPVDDGSYVSNSTVYLRQPGWSMHAYFLAQEGDQTHTWDNHNYSGSSYEENAAPDPKKDPCTSSTISQHTSKLHYNIVKVYDQEVLNIDYNEKTGEYSTEKGIEHVATTLRQQTLPSILIQDESPDYEVVEWKYTYDPYKPVEVGTVEENPLSTKWDDPAIADQTIPENGSGTTSGLVNINNKSDAKAEATLYVRLLKKLPGSETNTWDKEKYPKGDTPHPAPEPPEKPTKEDLGVPDIPDDIIDKIFPYDVNIIKTYQTYDKETGDYTHDGTYVREENPRIINIEDEGEYELKEWFTSSTYSDPEYETTWDEIISSTPSDGESGTEEIRIELTEPVLNVYLLLERVKEPDDLPGSGISSEDLTESQLTKISTTNSVPFNWSGYSFKANLEAAVTSHTYKDDDGEEHDCSMSRANTGGDNIISATFDILANDSHETSIANTSAHKDFAGTMYGVGGKKLTATPEVAVSGSALKFETTVDDEVHSWTLGSDGSNTESHGIEYITTISRQSAGDKLNLALYKKDAMSATSYARVNTLHPGANQPSGKRLSNGVISSTIGYTIGHIDSDKNAISACSTHSKTDTKNVTYDKTEVSLLGDFKIYTYGGSKDKVANSKPTNITGFNVKYTTSGDVSKDSALYCAAQSANLKFYPYIKMSYMITADNISFPGYNADPSKPNSRTVYMLSDKSSTILPTDSVEISWFNKTQADGGYGLQMTSTQWSVHNRATQGDDGWQGVNQVLPGGALYQLKTTNTESYIKTITYNTLVDDSSRAWINVSDNTKYTSNSVITEVNKYLDELTNIIDNYRIVQWVSTDIGPETAWSNKSTSVKIAGGGESLSNLGLSGKASTDSKYILVSGTNAEGPTEADIDIEREIYNTIVYKGFTDVNGDIYIAQLSVNTQNKRLDQATLDKVVSLLKPICGTNIKSSISGLDSNMSYSIVKIASKSDTLTKILKNLQSNSKYNYLYTIDTKTKFITNLVKSVERNTGDDKVNATWTDDGKWYNEAFDGMYLVTQESTYKVGIGVPSIRTAVLDPNLCPAKSSTSAIFTKAHMSQFCLDSKSTVAKDEADGYAGTFEGIKVYIPNLTTMLISRPFYIPNANVQDTVN